MPKVRTVDEIDRAIKELAIQRAQLARKDREDQRRARTRRHIVLGAWLEKNDPGYVERIAKLLDRPQDRAALEGTR